MPKKSFVLPSFYGLNTETDPRDLKPGELIVANDASVSSPGKIEICGKMSYYNSVTQAITYMQAGYGLFHFSSDYDWTETPVATRTNYLVIQNGANFVVVEDYDGTMSVKTADTAGGSLTLGGTSTFVRPSYYYVDNALRICDGNFAHTTNNRKWVGYINRTHFDDALDDTYNNWYIKDAEIAAPTVGLVGSVVSLSADDNAGGTSTNLLDTDAFEDWTADEIDDKGYLAVNLTDDETVEIERRADESNLATVELSGVNTWRADVYSIFPSAGNGFNIKVTTPTNSESDITPGNYIFACSFIYDELQESNLYLFAGQSVEVSSGEGMAMAVYCTSPFNPRITGARIYTKIFDGNDPWYHVVDIDLKEGVKAATSDSYDAWELISGYSGTNVYLKSSDQSIKSISTNTYEMLSDIDEVETSIDAKYKTACVVNRRAYIGNVFQNGVQYGDRMLKSLVNKFDVFPSKAFVDVSTNDGDDIVLLLAFESKILQFKRNKLHIVNVSQDYEVLDATYINRGIDYPSQAMAIENGIVWCNKIGVFYYDGQGVHEISSTISTEYKAFASVSNIVLGIGYDSVESKLFVCQSLYGLSTDVDGNAYEFDFKTKSWTFINDLFTNAASGVSRTNIILGVNGKPFVFEETDDRLYTFSSTPKTTSEFQIKTGDLDLGNVGIKKRVYAVILTYTSVTTVSNIKARVYLNGNTSSATALYGGETLPAATGWSRIVLEPSAYIDCYSISVDLYASGTVNPKFAVNDITIVYRELGVR